MEDYDPTLFNIHHVEAMMEGYFLDGNFKNGLNFYEKYVKSGEMIPREKTFVIYAKCILETLRECVEGERKSQIKRKGKMEKVESDLVRIEVSH